jgi:type IV secretion system protein VirD4
MEDLRKKKPNHVALKQYDVFKTAPTKTANSIVISAAVRLAQFGLPGIARMTARDELDFPSIGKRKVALFCVIPDIDKSYNFLISMLYTQAFQQLEHVADEQPDGRLPIHVHCIMDEFANIPLPEAFENVLSTARSREISISIILQNLAQLKALFDKQWESIVGNCDEYLYLGGNEQSTHKYVSELIGKETIDTSSYSLSQGRNGHYSTNYQRGGRELITPDEVRRICRRKAILFVASEPAVMDEKYDLLRHPAIRQTVDGGAPIFNYRTGLARMIANGLRPDDYDILNDEDTTESQTTPAA